MRNKSRKLWAVCPRIPLGNRPVIKGPLIFDSPRKARAFLHGASMNVYDGWGRGEEETFKSREEWLSEIADCWVGQPTNFTSYEQFGTDRPIEEFIALQMRERDAFSAKLTRCPVSKSAIGVRLRPGTDVYLSPFPRQVRQVTAGLIPFPLPVHKLRADAGAPCKLRLSEYEPEELNPTPVSTAPQLLDMCILKPDEEFLCCLHADWRFADIQREARRCKWHQAPNFNLEIQSPRQHFWRVVLEIEDALHKYHGNLSATSLRAFWISWQLSLHLCEIKCQVEQYAELPGAVAGEKHHIAEALTAVEFNLRSYVRELERVVIRHRKARPPAYKLPSRAPESASQTARSERKTNVVPQTTMRASGKPGPKQDLKSARKVAVTIKRVARAQPWKSKMEQICEALDKAKIAFPKTWRRREAPLRSWSDAWACEPDLAKKAINYRLKIAPS